MQIMKNDINGNEYTFVCEYWETSRAWGHKVTMFRNNYEYGSHKVRYYNRTWECYTYQTCILGIISKCLEQEKELAISNYKYGHGVSRLSKQEKENICNNVEVIKELEQLYKIRTRSST